MELKLKCADLIAQDRKGTERDDGRHKFMREHYEKCSKTIRESEFVLLVQITSLEVLK